MIYLKGMLKLPFAYTRPLIRFVFFIFFFAMGLLCLKVFYFLWIFNRHSGYRDHEAIVVFTGSNSRIKHGYQLAQQGAAAKLIISPATPQRLRLYEYWYGEPGNAEYIIEEDANTTFMNALLTARLVRVNGIRSVLLITSDYHMPRSYLLLKLTTIFTNCQISIYKVDTRYSSPRDRSDKIDSMKMAYNEMVQLWGSLIEAGLYLFGISKERAEVRTSDWSRWLREHLLFDVKYD